MYTRTSNTSPSCPKTGFEWGAPLALANAIGSRQYFGAVVGPSWWRPATRRMSHMLRDHIYTFAGGFTEAFARPKKSGV